MPRPVRILPLLLSCLTAALSFAAPAERLQNVRSVAAPRARRALVEHVYEWRTIRDRLGLNRNQDFASAHYAGRSIRRDPPLGKEHFSKAYQGTLSRLLDLDPKRNVLSANEWAELSNKAQFHTYQIRNQDEAIEFAFDDTKHLLTDTRMLEERARTRLAGILARAVRSKKPDPMTLLRVTRSLAEEFPFFRDPFQVELLIAIVVRGRLLLRVGISAARHTKAHRLHVSSRAGLRAQCVGSVGFMHSPIFCLPRIYTRMGW